MNTRKLIVKSAYGLNALLIIVLVGLLVYQQSLIRQMSDNERAVPPDAVVSVSNSLTGNRTQTTQMAESRVEQLVSDVETLRYQLSAAEEELEMTRGDLGDKIEAAEDAFRKSFAMEKKRREDPALMERERRGAENTIVGIYGVLFERLGLSDGKLQDLIALMVDNRMETDFLNMFLQDSSLLEENRKELQKQLEDQEAIFETQIQELLGSENYEEFNAYQKWYNDRSKERSILNSGIATPIPIRVDLGLSEEKEQALIDAMYEARKGVEAKYEGFDATAQWQQVSPNFGEQIERLLEVNDAYIESARSVLSESEAALFETRIIENKEGLKISRSLLEGDDDVSQ